MNQNIASIIVETPGVVGGRPRIDGTRISVRTIALWYKKGYSPEEIAELYEHLKLYHIYAALAYYHANQIEMEADMQNEESEYDRLMQMHYGYKKSA